MIHKTAIMVLAAGASNRLGTPKQLLPYRNTYLLAYCVEQVCTIPNADVFVILGSNAKSIAPTLQSLPVNLLVNTDWRKGMGNSIAFGILNLLNYKRVLISLGDLPLLQTNHYCELLKQHTASNSKITQTTYTDISGVPVVFEALYFKQLAQLKGDDGAKKILKKFISTVTNYTTNLPYLDVDTPEDYKLLIQGG